MITAIGRHRRPTLRDEDYYDLFEESDPIDTTDWHIDDLSIKSLFHHESSVSEGPEDWMSDDEPEESEIS